MGQLSFVPQMRGWCSVRGVRWVVWRWLGTAALLLIVVSSSLTAIAAPQTPVERGVFDIYKEMIEQNTSHPKGDNTALVEKAAARLRAAGFAAQDLEIIAPAPRKGNLVARIRGSGEKKPMLLLAHIDVVDARREDWSPDLDPFALTERDGYYYGRGTLDDKAMAAIFVDSFIRLKKSGFTPKRDIILALTCDEEGGTHNGIAHLLATRRPLIDAEFALNEGGGGTSENGKPVLQSVQVSEKMYLTYDFVATGAGGHSSVPERENTIYDLARALDRLASFAFPVRMSIVTRMYFSKVAQGERGALAKDIEDLVFNRASPEALARVSAVPRYNAQLRTTCVATRLEAGHADNALPQRARATVNCRLLPGESPAFVLQQLQEVAGDRVAVRARNDPRVSEASDPESAVMRVIARVSEQHWPGVPVIPTMSAGATDGSQLRNAGIPTYGASGLFVQNGEVRTHGRDERVGVRAFYAAQAFLHDLVQALANE